MISNSSTCQEDTVSSKSNQRYDSSIPTSLATDSCAVNQCYYQQQRQRQYPHTSSIRYTVLPIRIFSITVIIIIIQITHIFGFHYPSSSAFMGYKLRHFCGCLNNKLNKFGRLKQQHTTKRKMTSSTTTSNDYTETMPTNPLLTIGLPSPLVLGSASFTRKLILKEMGIPYHIMVRPIDERNVGDRQTDTPQELVQKVAQAKMDTIIQSLQNDEENSLKELPEDLTSFVILTADQVVTCQNKILEKATSIDEAIEFVQLYGTNPCSTVGAVILTHYPSLQQVKSVHTATIYFRPEITNDASELITNLVTDNAPILSCAGALMIEHPFTQNYVTKVDGTQDSVMGLCKQTVLSLLQQLKNKVNYDHS